MPRMFNRMFAILVLLIVAVVVGLPLFDYTTWFWVSIMSLWLISRG